MTHKYYRPDTDRLLISEPVIYRYGRAHRLVGPLTVDRAFGAWRISGRLVGPYDYDGSLTTKAAVPVDAKGNSLYFRTKRDALAAAEIARDRLGV